MDTKQTGEMPWDKIWDFRHYRVSRVRAVKYRVKLIPIRLRSRKERDETHKNGQIHKRRQGR